MAFTFKIHDHSSVLLLELFTYYLHRKDNEAFEFQSKGYTLLKQQTLLLCLTTLLHTTVWPILTVSRFYIPVEVNLSCHCLFIQDFKANFKLEFDWSGSILNPQAMIHNIFFRYYWNTWNLVCSDIFARGACLKYISISLF